MNRCDKIILYVPPGKIRSGARTCNRRADESGRCPAHPRSRPAAPSAPSDPGEPK